MPLPVFTPLDTTRLEVVLAIARTGTLEVTASATGMESLAPADLPVAVQTAGLVAGFQGTTPVAAELRVTRHDLVRLADGAVSLAHYAAALGDDGVVRVLGRLALSTRGRPWLKLSLPDGAELLEVAVGGRPGRPSRRSDGAVVIPLGDGANGTSVVTLVYELRVLDGRPGLSGRLRVPLPTLGGDGDSAPLPIERTELVLYLPKQLTVTAWGGELTPLALPTSLWETLMRDVAPVPRGQDVDHGDPGTDGLTVQVALHGSRYAFARLGDGGAVELRWWRRGTIDLLGLALAIAAVLLVWWSRNHGPRLGALALTAVVALAAASGVWSVAAIGFAGGTALGLVVLAGRWIILRRRAAPTPAHNPWQDVEPTP